MLEESVNSLLRLISPRYSPVKSCSETDSDVPIRVNKRILMPFSFDKFRTEINVIGLSWSSVRCFN